jgi:hypothetical protein
VSRKAVSLAAFFAGLAVAAGSALAAGDPWPGAHARLSYPVFKPTKTFGYKVSGSGFQPCPGGPSKASLYVTYGTYKGVLLSKTKGFDVFEGSPAICSDYGDFD